MAKSALPWLKKLCALYEKHDSSIYACTADAHVSGVLISLELDRGFMYLLAHPKGLTNSYAETESMSISIHQPEGSGQIPGNGELVARQFINVLSRADKGDIRITGNCTKGSKPESNVRRVSSVDADAAKSSQHEDIQWAAFVAYKSLVSTTPLTVDLSDPTEAQHQYLLDKLASGFNRSEFKERFGIDAADVVKGPFEKLMAMGFVSIDDNQVRTHFRDSAEEHVFRSYLYSPSYNLKAKSTWGREFDPTVDYQAEIRRLLAVQ